ncbi:uncharacterized protein VDAG_03166 [Verticillium dahliae VdLs.17]|uniref:Uncharacterized protein n=1 Tax=Verticillium dahliae (strain VdLs.17 / ATCC MYA-4575 / FGSC 10137) TaxID=498257 RepID=G2WYS4_VERDV|nr:uncharacterized protein VDAG_03166 [Verticillium dahliae VdLs.17]EGY21726.1 hypothetical protein VDAG_03166 [Verticillium dahliae VdLs.17]
MRDTTYSTDDGELDVPTEGEDGYSFTTTSKLAWLPALWSKTDPTSINVTTPWDPHSLADMRPAGVEPCRDIFDEHEIERDLPSTAARHAGLNSQATGGY